MKKLDNSTRGIVGIYKPVGPTSHDVVDMVRKITGERKVGHAGTLDPLASGVLVVGIGREATKKLSEIVGQEKEYVTEIKLGETSTTDDGEGEKTAKEVGDIPTRDQIDDVVQKFVGEIWQVPPIYSAVKVKGKEAYKLARKGKQVVLEPRKREVKEIELLSYEWPVLKLKVVTGKGVYIRSIARDMGDVLKVGGYMESLVRTRVGDFTLEKCLRINGS